MRQSLYTSQVDFADDVLTSKRARLLLFHPLKGNFVCGGVKLPVDLVTPGQRLSMQVCQRVILDSNHEIVPHKLYRLLYFPLRLPSVRPAHNGLEPAKSSNCRFSVESSCFSSRLMTTCFIAQDRLRVSSKVQKRILIAPYQYVCTHIRYKFDVTYPQIPQFP